MGNSAKWIPRQFDVNRAAQDAFAQQSHVRAIAAQDAGLFTDELTPVEVPAGRGTSATISADEPPRRDSNVKSLAGLRPAFASDGTVTAGNAPGITDGAA